MKLGGAFKLTHTSSKEDRKFLDQRSVKRIEALLLKTVESRQFIPESLLGPLGKEFANDSAKATPQGQADFKNGEELSTALVQQAFRVRNVHYAFYVSMMRAAAKFLKAPNLTLNSVGGGETYSVNKTIAYSPSSALAARVAVPQQSATVSGRWAGLRRSTLLAKRAGPRTMQTFWHHTGEGSAAFSSVVKDRVNRLKLAQFATNAKQTRIVRGSNHKGVTELIYSYNLQLPSVDARMDAMLGIPFATGKATAVRGFANTHTSQDTGTRTFRNNASGLDRIVMAESARPFLRPLALQVRKNMLDFLKPDRQTRTDNAVRSELLQNRAELNKAQAEQAKLKSWLDAKDHRQKKFNDRAANFRREYEAHKNRPNEMQRELDRLTKAHEESLNRKIKERAKAAKLAKDPNAEKVLQGAQKAIELKSWKAGMARWEVKVDQAMDRLKAARAHGGSHGIAAAENDAKKIAKAAAAYRARKPAK